MVGDQVELLVGMVHDASFGTVIACGRAGPRSSSSKMCRAHPSLTDQEAANMIRSLATLLLRVTGVPKTDVVALKNLLQRVSALVEAYPDIA
jgi:acetate---CoA ligase (ADP-forming)